MKNPVLITGAARSGTSMVAGIINLCGAFGGEMSPANRHNAKGMYENQVIRNQIVKPYLRKISADPMGQFPLPNINDLIIPGNWRNQILDVMIDQGLREGMPWMYKGAKMCLFWPVWNYAFPNAKWVVVRRKSSDIVTSCLKTGFMTAFAREEIQRRVGAENEREGWMWWIHQHEQRFVEMIQAGMNVKVVWPERMVNGDYTQMRELVDWLGLEWNPEVLNFIEPKLWKARKKLKKI